MRRSGRCWPGRWDRAARRKRAGRPRPPPPRSMSCANPFPSMSIRMAGNPALPRKHPPSEDLANAMRAGSLAVACLADVPDGPILGRNPEGSLAVVRTPEPGQLYRHHLERLAWMDELVASHGVRRALCTADLDAAHKAGSPRSSLTWKVSTSSTASSNGWRKRISAASGICSLCITRPTTSATIRQAPSAIGGSPHSAPNPVRLQPIHRILLRV